LVLLAACSSPAAPVVTQAPTPTFIPATEEPPDTETGVITFGTSYDETTLEIAKPQTKFKTSAKSIAWSASLSEPANASTLTIVIARVTSGGAESLLVKEDVDMSNPDFDILANKIDLAALVDRKAGTYVMRYLRDKDILAEGTFT
jgi:hypothetical protein